MKRKEARNYKQVFCLVEFCLGGTIGSEENKAKVDDVTSPVVTIIIPGARCLL